MAIPLKYKVSRHEVVKRAPLYSSFLAPGATLTKEIDWDPGFCYSSDRHFVISAKKNGNGKVLVTVRKIY